MVKFEDSEFQLDVNIDTNNDIVWLNRKQIAQLFERDVKTIGKHINIILKEELDTSTVAKFATVQKEGVIEKTREIEYYNLDMIISIGYRVKSKRGIIFRKWATNILKQYLFTGYLINQKRCLNCKDSILMLSNELRNLENKINNIEQIVVKTISLNQNYFMRIRYMMAIPLQSNYF